MVFHNLQYVVFFGGEEKVYKNRSWKPAHSFIPDIVNIYFSLFIENASLFSKSQRFGLIQSDWNIND